MTILDFSCSRIRYDLHSRLLLNSAMKTSKLSTVVLAIPLFVLAGSASAAGCIKGAVAGGVAGHYAGHHAVVGAVGGCIVGHHLAKKHAQEQAAAKAQLETQPQPGSVQ